MQIDLLDRSTSRMVTDWTQQGEQGSRPRVHFDAVSEAPVRAIAICNACVITTESGSEAVNSLPRLLANVG